MMEALRMDACSRLSVSKRVPLCVERESVPWGEYSRLVADRTTYVYISMEETFGVEGKKQMLVGVFL